MLLNLIDDSLVLEDRSVVSEVDFLGLLREHRYATTGIFVALLEGLQRGDGLATETEGVGDFDPVKLEGCAAL